MNLRKLVSCLFLLLVPLSCLAGDRDYLSIAAEESEIKAIAVVSKVRNMGSYADGTFKRVTFKLVYAVTPDTPKTFEAGCKSFDGKWQQRAEGTVYFTPQPGKRVFVTVSAAGGAITSMTPLGAELEYVIRKEPERLAYRRGKASILPKQ